MYYFKTFLFLLVFTNVQVFTERSGLSSDLTVSFNKLLDFMKSFPNYDFKKEQRKHNVKKAFRKNNQDPLDNNSETNNRSKHSKVQSKEASMEDSRMQSYQLIVRHGYRVESHTIFTQDGYLLGVFRVLSPSEDRTIKKKVVILHHGFMGSSDDWLYLGSRQSLPYLLLDAGFDVWLTNARGNKYSKANFEKDMHPNDYWDFSFHEMGTLDLPAVINYINESIEGKSEIHLIGHSMGGTAILILLSTLPQYNLILKSATLLAPLVFMYKIKGPINLLAEFHNESAYEFFDISNNNKQLSMEVLPLDIREIYCKGNRICLDPFLFLVNDGIKVENKIALANIMSRESTGLSVKTLKHYVQFAKTGLFQMFNYDVIQNLKIYGTKTAPPYKLDKIKIPIYLFSSKEDGLATAPNIVNLLIHIRTIAIHHVIRTFSHSDFVWSEDAPQYLNYLIVEYLNRVEKY